MLTGLPVSYLLRQGVILATGYLVVIDPHREPVVQGSNLGSSTLYAGECSLTSSGFYN